MKLALVTGGHRRVGAVIASHLEAAGWTVARHGAREDIAADLADRDAVEALIPRVSDRYGALPSLLVNNASRFVWDDVGSVTADALDAHHAVNARAPVMLALALHRAGGTGSIVNILDQRIRNPNADQLSYTLSKTALAGATRTLAITLAPALRVNAVAPGLTLPTADYTAAQLERLAAAMPLARLPEPEDIADAVLFLAAARALTGQTIFVDAGASLKSFDRDFVYL
ncbi:MAG: SDR family oxidoreductase [Sphingomonadaceae bacterium]